ncbi:hypothetical protein DdX_05481 [Ditylenchus destructor]|uniref:Uncharacterized protein n=1 Tax=Ditylenchus destructor TaxID=166010 RepID=A0AAD4N689_9BILA|nr:hypothetical protein DdX_05481 [Ditylenchus destructor]
MADYGLRNEDNGQWRRDIQPQQQATAVIRRRGGDVRGNSQEIRNKLTEYISGIGAVGWQDNYFYYEMVSTRSWTWAAVLFQLVLSCSALIASLAIVSAQMQSTDRYGIPQKPSLEVIIVCFLSFGLMFSTILAMFGLSNHHSSMLLPLILISLVICVFHATTTARLVMDCWPDKLLPPDSDTLFSVGFALFLQMAIIGTIYLEICCYRYL